MGICVERGFEMIVAVFKAGGGYVLRVRISFSPPASLDGREIPHPRTSKYAKHAPYFAIFRLQIGLEAVHELHSNRRMFRDSN
jgi:hypothetical protein